MTYKGWYAIKPKQPTNQPNTVGWSLEWGISVNQIRVNAKLFSWIEPISVYVQKKKKTF